MQALIHFFTQHPTLALAGVFAAALLESVAVIGTFIPGSTVVVAAGVLIGLQALDPGWAAGLAVLGAVLGDGFSYWLGRRYGAALHGWWPLKSHPEWFVRGQAYFAQHGGKSVFLGRFLGPLRAIVPVVAGMAQMPVLSFMVVNLLSAIAWSAAHLLPGALFGASLQLAGAVSGRLLMLLAGAAALVWLASVLLRLGHRRVGPLLGRQRDRLVAWARPRADLLSRVILSLLDPARPEALGLLTAATLLLGGIWMFLGITEDVLSGDPLVAWDHRVFTVLQQWRSGQLDAVMIAATELGGARVVVAVMAAVSAVLAWQRCWRTLAYWWAAVGFAQALVWVLKLSMARVRPMAMYDGAEQFSFPSGHAAASIVLYGFLAWLLARHRGPKVKQAVLLLSAALVGLIAFSRLYLGAHWLSDVLASLSLGLAWVALLSIVYGQHVRTERLPARALGSAALAALIVAGTAVVMSQHAADSVRYAPRAQPAPQVLSDWWGAGWRQLPARRTELDGDHEEPMSLQWAGTADQIGQLLLAVGWRRPPPWTLSTALLWLLPSSTVDELPVLAKWHQGQAANMSFARALDPSSRLVIRLWPTPYQVPGANGQPAPLWTGMLSRERLTHPAGLVTMATVAPGRGPLAAQLQPALLAQGAQLVVRRRDGADILLVE